MAKFCTKCGEKTENCKCENSAATVTEKKVKNEVVDTTNVSSVFNVVVEIVKGIFIMPISTIKKYATEKNINLGYILIGILIAVQAMFIVAVASNYTEGFNDYIQDEGDTPIELLGNIAEGDIDAEDISYFTGMILLYTASDGEYEDLDDPLGKFFEIDDDELVLDTTNVFIHSAFAFAAYSALLAGSIYIAITMFLKQKLSIPKMTVTYAVTSAINIGVYLAAIVSLYIIPSLTIYILAIGNILFMYSLFMGIAENENYNKDKYTLTFVLATVINMLAIYVFLQLFI